MLGDQDPELLRRDRVSQNVVLTVPGASERTIIVGAHYDSPPDPGTSDNASGVALLMESAKRMMDYDNYYTIRYIFFGAEEVGLVGAAWNLHQMSEEERDNVVMMVNGDVLIEGPVLVYGAAAQQSFADMSREEFIVAMEAMLREQIQHMINSPWWEDEMMWMGVETEEEAFEFLEVQVEWQLTMFEMMPDLLFDRQLQHMHGMGWDITPEAAHVSEIAAGLAETHGIEFYSIPRAVAFSTDSWIYLQAGFTVVNLVGLEYIDDVSDELRMQLWRFGEGFPEYGLTVTVLHTPLDCFYFIEENWPGMIQNNMYAFLTFLNAILLSRSL